jgi:hypothetical protein
LQKLVEARTLFNSPFDSPSRRHQRWTDGTTVFHGARLMKRLQIAISMNVQRGLTLAAWLLCSVVAASGAKIEKQAIAGDPSDLIIISGVFSAGDDQTFREIAATSKQAVFLLDSEGGSVEAALEIGKAIRLKGFATAVLPNTLCASACALTWLAGTTRFLSETSHIGFHASYVLTDGKPSESGVANALIGAYLNQIGLSQEAIIFITSAPPEGMEWLSRDNATQLGVSVTNLDEEDNQNVAGNTGDTSEIYDPLGTVAAFYSALAAADGETAAAFVIPEKRGLGPFNEQSIHNFFGTLSVPLKVKAVSMKSETEVFVAYGYTKADGAVCDGQANVETVFRFGKTLISKIRALKGC